MGCPVGPQIDRLGPLIERLMALIASFILMGIVVFISFRPNYIPSAAVMLAGFSDIVVTIAIAASLLFT